MLLYLYLNKGLAGGIFSGGKCNIVLSVAPGAHLLLLRFD